MRLHGDEIPPSFLPPGWRDALRIAGSAAIYFLAIALVSFSPVSKQALVMAWPAGGIALAALLLNPPKLRVVLVPALLLFGAAAEILAGKSVVFSLGFIAVNVLETVGCAWLILSVCGPDTRFDKVRDVGALLLAAVVLNAATALLGSALFIGTPGASLWSAWRTWWIRDALGILIFTPLALAWLKPDPSRPSAFTSRQAIELAVFLIPWGILAWLSFGSGMEDSFVPQPYIVAALIALPALRLGQRGVTTSLTLLAAIVFARLATRPDLAFLQGEALLDRLFRAQAFLGITAIGGFLLSASYGENKRARDRLHESQEKLLRAQRVAGVGSWEWDLKTGLVEWSDEMGRMFGLDAGITAGNMREGMEKTVHPDDLAMVQKANRDLLDGKAPIPLTYRVVWPDASVHVIRAETGSLVRDSRGLPIHLSGIAVDVTAQERTAATQAGTIDLLKICNEARSVKGMVNGLAAFFQKMTGVEGVGIRLRDGSDFPYCATNGLPEEFVRMENSLCSMDAEGVPVRDANGLPILECMCGNVLTGKVDAVLPFFTARGSFWTGSTTSLLAGTTESERQGRTRNRCNGAGFETVALIPIRMRGEIVGLLQLTDRRANMLDRARVKDIEGFIDYVGIALAKLKAEEMLRDTERRLRLTIEGGNIGTWRVDLEKRIVELSERAAELHGLAPGRTVSFEAAHAAVHPDDNKRVAEAILQAGTSPEPLALEYRVLRPDGATRWLSIRAGQFTDEGTRQIFGIAIDITDRRHAEEERRDFDRRMLVAQKVESLGILAGGVAHNFNNLLSVMLGYAELLQSKLPAELGFSNAVAEIIKAARKSRELTGQLLSMARQQLVTLTPVDLNEIINEARSLLRHAVRENVAIEMKLSPTLGPILADPGRVTQVLVNLSMNAQDAMPTGGTLTLETMETIRERTGRDPRGQPALGDIHLPARDRHRPGDERGNPWEDFRSVFHDERTGKGNRARAFNRLWHHDAAWRRYRRGKHAGRGDFLHAVFPAGFRGVENGPGPGDGAA